MRNKKTHCQNGISGKSRDNCSHDQYPSNPKLGILDGEWKGEVIQNEPDFSKHGCDYGKQVQM